MKKFLLAAVLIVGISVAQVSQTEAFYEPYENDANFAYVYTAGSGNARMYLDLNSVDVQEYDPPHYQIAGTFILQSGNSPHNEIRYTEMRFNYSTKEVSMRHEDGRWYRYGSYVESDYSDLISYYVRTMANALFRAAYRMNFYN